MLSVSLHGGESTHVPLSAFVKVPRQSDANLAIEKVHQREIFNSRVTVNMATKKVKQHRHLMLEVVSILEEVPLYFLPLDKFLSDYHKKFSKMFEMNSLICLQDWVVLTGKPGNQAISLVTKAIGGVRVSVDPDQFANDVHTLLKSCGGSLPLVSFAASYLLEFDRKIESNVQGSALKEVLRFVPNVKVTESLTVSWAQQALEHGMRCFFSLFFSFHMFFFVLMFCLFFFSFLNFDRCFLVLIMLSDLNGEIVFVMVWICTACLLMQVQIFFMYSIGILMSCGLFFLVIYSSHIFKPFCLFFTLKLALLT